MKSLTPSPKQSHLLIVEDEPAIRAALRKYFHGFGYEVDCASELEEAEALITTIHYDLVIADLRLTWSFAVEGLEILRFIRRHSRETQVIVLSAHTGAEIQESAEALGAAAFISKPAPLPVIAEVVARLLEGHPA